jgi:hypothetical protein
LSIEGANAGETRNSRAMSMPEKLLYGSLQTVIFGSALAEQGVGAFIDMHHRSAQTKLNAYVAVVAGSIESVYGTETKQSEDVGRLLSELLRQSSSSTFVSPSTLHRLAMTVYSDDCGDMLLPLLCNSDSGIKICGLAAFRRDRMVGEATGADATALTLLSGAACKGYLPFETPEDSGTVCVQNRRNVRAYLKNGTVCIDIRIRLEGFVCEHTDRSRRLDSPGVLSGIEDAVSAQTMLQIDRMLQTVCKEWRCDCIDVTRYTKALFRKDPPADVRDLISTATVRASVETKLRFNGEVM